jgi:hypothetical protein
MPGPGTSYFKLSLRWQAHATTPSFFPLRWGLTSIQIRSCWPRTTILPISSSRELEMTGIQLSPLPQYWLRWGSQELFVWAIIKLWSSQSQFPRVTRLPFNFSICYLFFLSLSYFFLFCLLVSISRFLLNWKSYQFFKFSFYFHY